MRSVLVRSLKHLCSSEIIISEVITSLAIKHFLQDVMFLMKASTDSKDTQLSLTAQFYYKLKKIFAILMLSSLLLLKCFTKLMGFLENIIKKPAPDPLHSNYSK